MSVLVLKYSLSLFAEIYRTRNDIHESSQNTRRGWRTRRRNKGTSTKQRTQTGKSRSKTPRRHHSNTYHPHPSPHPKHIDPRRFRNKRRQCRAEQSPPQPLPYRAMHPRTAEQKAPPFHHAVYKRCAREAGGERAVTSGVISSSVIYVCVL